jgi:UDP-N-acetylmuramyl pentapeptide synthase
MQPEQIVVGTSHEHLAEEISQYITAGDLLLFKGSRGLKMETVLTAVLELLRN